MLPPIILHHVIKAIFFLTSFQTTPAPIITVPVAVVRFEPPIPYPKVPGRQ